MENLNSITTLVLTFMQIAAFVLVTYKVFFQFGGRLTKIEEGIASLNQKFFILDKKIDDLEIRLLDKIGSVESALSDRIISIESSLSGRFDRLDKRIDKIDLRIQRLEERLDRVEAKFEKKIDYAIKKIEKIDDKLERKFDVVFWRTYDQNVRFNKSPILS